MPTDVSHAHQKAQIERLIKTADKVNREIQIVVRASEVAANLGSFHSQRLLARARDHLEDALLEIREAQRVLPETEQTPGEDDDD
jgi:chaperonin cofactor prefoldin